MIEDYRGALVMSAYTAVSVGEHRWALLADIEVNELNRGAAAERPGMTGLLSLFYGLCLWSVWYWRGRDLPVTGGSLAGDAAVPALGDDAGPAA
ncbi:hypothetical protein GCM10007053_11950 [Halioglobus pacificus]|uniref:Uncharacterized protein n=1 Tax=Parahalioglobus pacificus TaxID=930806 RepID=A0A919CJ15_9GAMM|nr:hypothetical protein GCM10007053_11950 [Halioglobus pacificus]